MTERTKPPWGDKIEITEQSFVADLLYQRNQLPGLIAKKVVTPEEGDAYDRSIIRTLEIIRAAHQADLRIKFYQSKEGDRYYSMEPKGKLGFLK